MNGAEIWIFYTINRENKPNDFLNKIQKRGVRQTIKLIENQILQIPHKLYRLIAGSQNLPKSSGSAD